MSGLPPGDPQLVAMIVNHLKTQGLFDQFRRDCLADVDTKPAYLHLRQRVDNFVSNHLSNHTWSPQLNKNQLRNNIRQLVLQSGMLEQGVDRIVAQVVDPKIHHTFRPQVERIVRQFLSPGSHTEEEEPPVAHSLLVENQDTKLLSPVLSSVTAPAVGADPADSTSSQSQEEAGAEPPQDGPVPNEEEGEAALGLVQDVPGEQEEREEERGEGGAGKPADDGDATCVLEDRESEMEVEREAESARIEEEEEEEEAQKGSGVAGRSGEEEEEEQKGPGEKQHIRQRARERLKEEYSLEDSDLEGLSDITVSSVHTSDLSSFEGESEGEQAPSDTTEEGEITSEDDRVLRKSASEEENKEKKPRGVRQGYVHKPFLYSRYYSDSDDEVTVEQRRRSAAKEKEERVLKRQQNRERLEEKRRQKAAQSDLQEKEKHATATSNQEAPRPQAKEARKEKKVLEKKVALSRKRKRDSRREDESGSRKKSDADVDVVKKEEALKFKAAPPKPSRKLSEAEEPRRRKSASVSEDDPCESRATLDKNRTHSFILDLEMGSEEVPRQRGAGRSERHAPRREAPPRDREHGGSEERLKRRPKTDDRDAPADRAEKKGSKVKGERKSWAAVREGRLSVSEGLEEGAIKTGKKSKSVSETLREKTKGEKSGRAETNPLESTVSIEERSEVETTSELNKKKDKHTKDVLKKSKSHMEVRTSEKVKGRQDSERERVRAEPSTAESPRNLPETGSKVKPVGDKPRSKTRDDVKPQSPPGSRADKESKVTKVVKVRTGAAPGRAELCRERKREDRTKDAKTVRKTSEKRIKDIEKKVCEGEERSSPTEEPSDLHAPSDLTDQTPPQPSDTQTAPDLPDEIHPQPSDTQTASDLPDEIPPLPSDTQTASDLPDEIPPQPSDTQTVSDLPDETPSQPSDAQTASDLPDETPPQPSDAQTASDLTDEMPPQSSHAQGRSDLRAGQTSASLEESDLAGSSWSNFKEPQMGDSPTHSATITPQALDNKSDLADVQASDALAEPEFTGTIPNQPADSCLGSVLVAMETAPESCPVAGLGHGVADDTTVPDDMYDALSDITPEPEDEGEAAMRLAESQEQSRPLPVEADALLTLVDVCASVSGSEVGGMPDGQEAERSFHEADMKMQEAALTLLSMDVHVSMDAHVSMAQSLITEPCHLVDTTLAIEETPVARQQVQPQHPDLGDVPEEVTKESERDTVSGVQPDLEGGTSEDGDQQPNMGDEASKDRDQQPDVGGGASEDGDQQPDVGGEASEDGDQQPGVGGGASEDGDQQPGVGGGASEDGDQQPGVGGGASEDGDQQPGVGGGASEDGDQQPGVGGGASEDGDQQPGVGGGASEDGDQQSELGGGASEDGDQQSHAPALINTDIDVMATERASTEEVMSQGACDVQANSFEAVCLSQSEAPDDPTLAPGDASAGTEPSPTWTRSPSPDHMTAHTQVAETQAETHAQEDQSKDDTHESPGADASRESPGADASRESPGADASRESPGADASRESPGADASRESPGADASREPPGADASRAGPREAGEDRGLTELDTVTVQEMQAQPARRGRPPKLTKQTSSTSRSDGREEDRSDASEVEDRVESRVARKGRPANQKAAADKHSGAAEQETKEPDNTAPKKDEDEDVEEGRSTMLPDTPQQDALSQLQEVEATGDNLELKEMRRGRRRSGVHPSSAAKLSLKRKRSDQAEDSGKELPAEEEAMKRARHDSDVAEDVGEEKCEEAESERESSKDSKEETEEEEKDEPVRKTPRRGRPSKSTSGTEDAASSEKREGEEPGEDEEETKTRATTRAASRLEAEKNKPSKPSTRAFSRLSVKEESSPITRASRAQVSGTMKGRKCEASPPAPRTRAAHKAEEPAAKRTKR